jgi:hypothetical protein
MRLTLTEDVHGALVDGDLVLLAVKADTYFCLPAGGHRLALKGRVLETEPEALAQALMAAGLAEPAKGVVPVLSAPLRPRRSARAALDADPALKATPATPRHLLALARAARGASLAEHRAFAERLQPLDAPLARLSPALLADLAVFRRLAPWLPIDGACLFRSQMLRAYLAALGHGVTWCFGVRTWPFMAHCWLQVEDMALDDEAERLCAFHPILAV